MDLNKEIIQFKKKIIQEGPLHDIQSQLSSPGDNHDELKKIAVKSINDQRLINNNFEKFKELAKTITDDNEKQEFFKFFIDEEYYKTNYNEDFTINNVYEIFEKKYKDGNLENINIKEEDNNSDNEKNLKLIKGYIPTKVTSVSTTYANQILEIYNDILEEKNTKFNPTFFSEYSDEIIKYLKDNNNNNDYSHNLRKELIVLFTLLTEGNTKKKYNKALKALKDNMTGGKRKSRRNRKSKKGKRSRKARKSRRKSNRRRGRR